MSNLARYQLEQVPLDLPGKPMEMIQEEMGLKEVFSLAANENCLGTSPKALKAMKQAVDNSFKYPDRGSLLLRQKVASMLEIDDDMVLFANGADNIITLISLAFVNEGDEVIVGDPSFFVYDTVTQIMGGKLVKVPLRNFTYDLPGIVERITEKTKVVIVCNPNNPTGTIVTEEQVADFMEKVPPRCVVIFDQAYEEFVDEKRYPQTVKYIHENRNVLLVRTFSKLYGLAGARVGYAAGPKHLIEILRKVVEYFPVNRLAQAGALAALDDGEFVEKVLEVNKQGKKYLYQEFSKLDMTYIPSHTNFIFVNLGMDSQMVAKKLLEQGIFIASGYTWNLPEFARITIGKPETNKKLIQELKKLKK